jgi:hypothetical protein
LRGGHLDHVRAVEALARIHPAKAMPIHWGTYWPIGLHRGWRFAQPGGRFAEEAARSTPEVDVRMGEIGERHVITALLDELARPESVHSTVARSF